jgi:hypothetical protein
VGLEYEFLVANYGMQNKPQKGIVGMKINYIMGSLKAYCDNPNCANTKYPFEIKSYVTFTLVDSQTLKTYVPPSPVFIGNLPSDIFYPLLL